MLESQREFPRSQGWAENSTWSHLRLAGTQLQGHTCHPFPGHVSGKLGPGYSWVLSPGPPCPCVQCLTWGHLGTHADSPTHTPWPCPPWSAWAQTSGSGPAPAALQPVSTPPSLRTSKRCYTAPGRAHAQYQWGLLQAVPHPHAGNSRLLPEAEPPAGSHCTVLVVGACSGQLACAALHPPAE